MAGRFRSARDGVAAIEFALILPVMVLLLGGAIELGGALTASNRATYVAETIGQAVAQSQETLSTDDIDAYIRTAALINPDIVAYAKATGTSLDKAADVAISSIAFTLQKAGCKNNCKYDAQVVFSRALSGAKRSCVTLVPASDGSVNSLPPEVYSANSIVELRVTVHYRPFMTSILGKSVDFQRTMYFRPRYVDTVKSTANCSTYVATS